MPASKKIAISTRRYRKWHRNVALIAGSLLLLVSITGILLAWKKNSFGLLQAKTATGSSNIPASWQSIAAIQHAAVHHLQLQQPQADTIIDRIDVRPDNGIAKVIFKNHYTAIQVDLGTAEILLMETRRADLIEQIHDGSILDRFLPGNLGKLSISSISGFGLLILTISGFYLWFNPQKIRKHKRGHRKKHPHDLPPTTASDESAA